MSDKELIVALRDYAKVYSNGQPYSLNPGLAIMAANRIEELGSLVKPYDLTQRFNVGDKIWVAECYDSDYYVVNEDGEYVYSIDIYVGEYSITFYTIKRDGELQEYASHFCFKNYEECQQWCDLQNKKEAKQC